MKSSDRAILLGVLILGMLAAAWFLLLAPKRDEAATLEDEVAALEAEVAEQEALIAEGTAAREDFDENYRQLIVLGKAVPEAADTSSLITEFSELSSRTDLDFRALDLVEAQGAAPVSAASQTTADDAPASGEPAEEAPAEEAPAEAPPVPATEASAAALPIGAAVGPAGLPVMPYAMEFSGDFFHFADFLGGLDGLVHSRGESVVVNGRLLTVDGFSFEADPRRGYPHLLGELTLSSYVTPEDQGLVAGATPTAPAPTTPAPATEAPTTPAAGTTPTSSTTP